MFTYLLGHITRIIHDRGGFVLQPIVADMRKVLAKHPQVEQQRLHRRVFFDNVDPENQSLLVSDNIFSSIE